MNSIKNIVVIDGQGGKIGAQLIEQLVEMQDVCITAIGTNSTATFAMKKGGAHKVATGENALVVACRKADIIVGPLGIVVADALVGEISPLMATAVGQSEAYKVLIPLNKCNNMVAGTANVPINEVLAQAVTMIKNLV